MLEEMPMAVAEVGPTLITSCAAQGKGGIQEVEADRLRVGTPGDRCKGLASAKASGPCREKTAAELEAGCRHSAPALLA